MSLLVSVESVREYMQWQADNPTGNSSYTSATIGSNIRAAQGMLEHATGRYFTPRSFTVGAPFIITGLNAAQVPLPGFRSISDVIQDGSSLTVNASYWLIPDAMQTGVYVGIAFRPTVPRYGLPWWWGNPRWFDSNLDNPYYTPNTGGPGWFYTSPVNNLAVVGEAGFDPSLALGVAGAVPYDVMHAVKVLAAFYTTRPASILADVAITPQGGVLNYSQMPAEVARFIVDWKRGPQMISVG